MDGVEYWRLEQSLCTSLSAKEEASLKNSISFIMLLASFVGCFLR